MPGSCWSVEDARPEDAGEMLAVHRAAVRGTAVAAYDQPVLDAWAPLPITSAQVDALSRRLADGEEVAVVARTPAGEIVGFGSIVAAASELRAVYVAPAAGGRGVGRALLDRLVDKALAIGLTHLAMDASINAEAFYLRNGFRTESSGEHVLQSGARMACVRMRRNLKD